MARQLRIQYPGALYHVVNRGNYRSDLFETAGAAQAFVDVIEQASARYGWKVFAYALMRNHYHLVLETPQPNLTEGMHWLQCTYSTRFNRYRSERGHLFQGRYHAGVIEDSRILGHIVDYVHLNPVRAKIVEADKASSFRWSSLARYVKGPRFASLVALDWLKSKGLEDNAAGWTVYQGELAALASNLEEQKRLGWDKFSYGWAHGSESWRRALAHDLRQHTLDPGIEAGQLKELKEEHWRDLLEQALLQAGKTEGDLNTQTYKVPWKMDIAIRLRGSGISIRWLSERLCFGNPNSLRSYLCRAGKENQQTTS